MRLNETPDYISGGEGKAFEISGPWPNGTICVEKPNSGVAAAKLIYKDGRWVHSLSHTTYFDSEQNPIVDILAAIEKAMEAFPSGPRNE